jgi:hypothetical protein
MNRLAASFNKADFTDCIFEDEAEFVCLQYRKQFDPSRYGKDFEDALRSQDSIHVSLGRPAYALAAMDSPRVDELLPTAASTLEEVKLLTAIASLCARPKALTRIFVGGLDAAAPTASVSCLRLMQTGVWREVVLDHCFPRQQAVDGPIWPALLCKALRVIGADRPSSFAEALSTLTPAKCSTLRAATCGPEVVDLLLKFPAICSFDERSAFVVTGCPVRGKVQLITLASIDSKWTGGGAVDADRRIDELKRRHRQPDEDAGVFHISFADFKAYFQSVTVCHFHDDYTYSYLPVALQNRLHCLLEFSLDKRGDYYLGLSQTDANAHSNDPSYEYAYAKGFVFTKDRDGFRFVGGFAGAERDPWTRLELEAGMYAVVLFASYPQIDRDFTFWTYGVSRSPMRVVSSAKQVEQIPEIIGSCLTRYAFESPDKWERTYEDDQDLSLAREKTEELPCGYGFYIFDNKVDSLTLHITMTIEDDSLECSWMHCSGAVRDNLVVLEASPKQPACCVYELTAVPNSSNISKSIQAE